MAKMGLLQAVALPLVPAERRLLRRIHSVLEALGLVEKTYLPSEIEHSSTLLRRSTRKITGARLRHSALRRALPANSTRFECLKRAPVISVYCGGEESKSCSISDAA